MPGTHVAALSGAGPTYGGVAPDEALQRRATEQAGVGCCAELGRCATFSYRGSI